MTVSLPPLVLKGTPKTNVTSTADHPILDKISSLLPRLSHDELAGLSIAALNEAFEPATLFVDFAIRGSHAFNHCIALLQDLSQASKVALVRGLADLLAASPGIGDRPTSPTLPPVPQPHPENAWGVLALEDAIALCKAGLIDPAVLLWVYPIQSLRVFPPELLATATKRFPELHKLIGEPQ